MKTKFKLCRLNSCRSSAILPVFIAALLLSLAASCPAQIDLWHLDEGSGATTADSAGSNPGILYGFPQWVSGVAGNALEFNGSSQYVGLAAAPILAIQNFTIEAWIKWDGGGAAGYQEVYCEGSFNDLIDFGLNSGVPIFVVDNQSVGWGIVSALSPLPVGQWHHLAGVLQSGVGGILYVDGQAVATNASVGPLNFASYGGETDIGRFAGDGGSRYFSGTIDEVELFDTVRSAAQILADYQQYSSAPAWVQYSVDWFKIAGGGGTSTGSIYSLTGTIGQPEAGGAMSGGGYSMTGGFWSLISLIQSAGLPSLSITRSGQNIIVSWPGSGSYTLQQNNTLAGGAWITSGYAITSVNGTNSVSLIAPAGNLFFRLQQ